MSYYQGDYYQGDFFRKLGRKVGRYFRKKVAPELRKAAPLLGFVPGVGVVGAGAINALTKSRSPNRTTADTLMAVLAGPGARPEIKPMRAKGTAKRTSAPARRPISPLMRSRGNTTSRARVMSPYARNQAARRRAAAARRSR